MDFKPLNMARGIFFVAEFSAKGGTAYRRVGQETVEQHEDESLTAEYTTCKQVDHIGLDKWSRSIVNRAYAVMDKYCSPTPIGYWIAEERSPKLLEEISQCRAEAMKLNAYAKSVGSRRRALIDVYGMHVGPEDLTKVASRLAQTIRERLESLLEDLKAGNLNAYATSWKRARNLPKLAVGLQADSIVLALEAARQLRSELAELLNQNRSPEEAGKALDTSIIESAILLFTGTVTGGVEEVLDPALDRAA